VVQGQLAQMLHLKAQLDTSAMRTVSCCCSYRPVDRARAFLSVLEVTSFHPLLSPEVALAVLLGTGSGCISTAAGVWGS